MSDTGSSAPSWSGVALAACLEELRVGTVTESRRVSVDSAWTDGPTAFCVVYSNPYFDGLIGLRRDASDALAATMGDNWTPDMMTSGYEMGDR